jgi:hypothetical protein
MALRGEALDLAHWIYEINLKTEATCKTEYLQAVLQPRDISAVQLQVTYKTSLQEQYQKYAAT